MITRHTKRGNMRAPISVIIPTLNSAAQLPSCLGALMEGLDAGLIRELIVSDGGSEDATGATAQAWGAVVLHGEPSRGGQLRRACATAKAAWCAPNSKPLQSRTSSTASPTGTGHGCGPPREAYYVFSAKACRIGCIARDAVRRRRQRSWVAWVDFP